MGVRKIDREQAEKMLSIYPQHIVAKKLNCSTRQLRRICTPNPSSGHSPITPQPDEEVFLMQYFRTEFNESYEEIGKRFGMSKQAVQQRLNPTNKEES